MNGTTEFYATLNATLPELAGSEHGDKHIPAVPGNTPLPDADQLTRWHESPLK